jgi:hypothetical protein
MIRPKLMLLNKDGNMFYAFYSSNESPFLPLKTNAKNIWKGEVELRGLLPGAYRVVDYVNNKEIGTDHIWRSEGFATYFTLLCSEHYGGRDAFVAGLKRGREVVFAQEKRNPGIAVLHSNLSDMSKVLNQGTGGRSL